MDYIAVYSRPYGLEIVGLLHKLGIFKKNEVGAS